MKKSISLSTLLFLLFFGQILAGNAEYFKFDYQKVQNELQELINLEEVVLDGITLKINEAEANFVFEAGQLKMFIGSGDSATICEKAVLDAKSYYKATGPFFATFCCAGGTNPLFGLILAAVTLGNPPKYENLKMPTNEYSSDPLYKKCYIEQAHKKRKTALWAGIGAGTVVYAVALLYLL